MSERARSRAGCRIALAGVAAILSSPLTAQTTPARDANVPAIRGTVVRDADSTPVVGARVEANQRARSRPAVTDDSGRFALEASAPKCFQSNATNTNPYDYVEYLKISAPGLGLTLVDPCSDAPWALPIRVRASATLRGRIELVPADPNSGEGTTPSARAGHHVAAILRWQDLCWPPRTGLTRTDIRLVGDLDAEGRFEIRDVPAQTPISLRFDAGTGGGAGIRLLDDFALTPGEVRELTLLADGSAATPSVAEKLPSGTWIPVAPGATVRAGASANLTAFEVHEGGRFERHKVGGGRWHVHGSRACNDLQALPGLRTLVAFDARGQIGLARFEVRASDLRVAPLAELAPGALLRIAFDGPEQRARIALVSKGIEFAAREVPRGVVWYELVPAGEIAVRVAGADAPQRELSVEARPGTIEHLALARGR